MFSAKELHTIAAAHNLLKEEAARKGAQVFIEKALAAAKIGLFHVYLGAVPDAVVKVLQEHFQAEIDDEGGVTLYWRKI